MSVDAPPQHGPRPPGERLAVVDALRGIALLGVVVVNADAHFRITTFQPLVGAAPPATPTEAFVAGAVSLVFEWKALSLFAFLFGAGLAAQRERAGAAWALYLSRRQCVLFALGVAHMVFVFGGDILAFYAVLGLVASVALSLSARTLAALAVGFFALQIAPLPVYPFASIEDAQEHVAVAQRVYAGGSYGDVLRFRVHELRPLLVLLSRSAPRNLGLFLLGAAAWRARMFSPSQRSRALLIVAALGLAAGAAHAAAHFELIRGAARDVVYESGGALFALGLAALLVRVSRRPLALQAMRLFAPLGRMSLTAYLSQSLVLGAIFYGYGLGLMGRVSRATTFAIALGLYLALLVASRAWLRRASWGPVEWAWRAATYGAMRRPKS
ncbi:MAG: DUF418 domain-containing protein [Polyangiaceae bacterium]